jgi:hypothetical protein
MDLFAPRADGTSSGCGSCAGCCLQGTCQTGDSPGACGSGGMECQTCVTGQQCVSGQCVNTQPSCSFANCPSGCCGSSGCVDPPTDNQCGTGGASCQACVGGQVCRQGQCDSGSSTGTFQVKLVGVVLDKDACGWFGTVTDDCDPFAEVTFKGTMYPTPVLANTNEPVWDADLFSASAADLRSNPIDVKLIDEDTGLNMNDELGTCSLQVTESALNAGELVQSCGQYAQGLKFTFKLQN